MGQRWRLDAAVIWKWEVMICEPVEAAKLDLGPLFCLRRKFTLEFLWFVSAFVFSSSLLVEVTTLCVLRIGIGWRVGDETGNEGESVRKYRGGKREFGFIVKKKSVMEV